MALLPPKPVKSYPELIALLASRGRALPDPAKAQRKLAQVGYYRLSGFWFPCRQYKLTPVGTVQISALLGKPLRSNAFLPGTSFDAVFNLYLLDKKLRQLMLDGLERLKVFVRSAIEHEIGYQHPLTYQDAQYINPNQTQTYIDARGVKRNAWQEWGKRQNEQVNRSHEGCIAWHRISNKAMPFWVVVKVWGFGTVSKYFEMLKGSLQNRVCARLGVLNAKVLKVWLQELNTLHNRCVHHTRIWNQTLEKPLPVLHDPYFQELVLDTNARTRLLGLVVVLKYLEFKIDSSSTCLQEVADVMDRKPALPGCTCQAIGASNGNGFPRPAFGLSNIKDNLAHAEVGDFQ